MNREQFDEYEKNYIEILALKDEKLNNYMIVSEKYDKVFDDRYKLVTDCEDRHRISSLKRVMIAGGFAISFTTLLIFLDHLIPANRNVFLENYFFIAYKAAYNILAFGGFCSTLFLIGRMKNLEDCMLNARVEAVEIMQNRLRNLK